MQDTIPRTDSLTPADQSFAAETGVHHLEPDPQHAGSQDSEDRHLDPKADTRVQVAGISIAGNQPGGHGRLASLSSRLRAQSDPANKPSLARTPKTEKLYAGLVQQLYRRSIASRSTDPQQPANVSPLDVIQDFLQTAAERSPSSWNLYRAAMLWHMAQHRDMAPQYVAAYELLANTRQAPQLPNGKRKHSTKRTIPEEDLNELINVLGGMNRTTNWGARTQFWVQAGLASGARPIEWLGASWLDDRQSILCIPNAKRKRTVPIFSIVGQGETIHDVERLHPERLTKGCEFDDLKRIRNVPVAPADRIYVNLHLGALNDYLDAVPGADRSERFVAYYNMCRKVLRDACIRAFHGKKSYSLYVMRSQFAANMKAVLPLADVAELMGHTPRGTVTKANYGPRRAAFRGHAALQQHVVTDGLDKASAQDGPTSKPGAE